MREDRRKRYDDGFRHEALGLIKAGAGKHFLARRLAMPVQTAEKWIMKYRLRGAESACRETWPDTRIQRCLVHVQRNTRTDLTSRPRLEAGRELKKLSDKLTAVRDTEAAARWGEALNAWHIRWRDFIAERTYARDDPANPKASKQEWWWTHQELRRCYRRLEKLFREGRLFAFLDPSLTAVGPVARTTNRLEGGVNSPLKRMLLNHRGLPEEHMRRACEWMCYMKSRNPCVCSIESGPCERVESLQMSGRF